MEKRYELRRSDRALDNEAAYGLLAAAEYGILSTADPGGQPYGVPLSFCMLEDGIYFHCAVEGHKLDNLAQNPKASFCVVGRTRVLPGKFSTAYESVIVYGTVSEVFGAGKRAGMEGLLRKYSAEHFEKGLKYIDSLDWKTKVFRLTIDAVSAKARKAE